MDISERTATAMLYAIKSDTLFFQRHANRADIEAFSYLYPLGDATMIRKMEGAEITAERLDYLIKAWQQGRMMEHVFCAFLGEPPREDFIPYVADFYLQLENVQWTVISGVVNDQFVVSVRNLGYSRNAGDFVRRWFNDIGSAGGHRTMAKAVVPRRSVPEEVRHLRRQPHQPAHARARARVPARNQGEVSRQPEAVPTAMCGIAGFVNLDGAPADAARGCGDDARDPSPWAGRSRPDAVVTPPG